ncbi:MAG: CRISPR-associated endonuclease Cas6 [Desulfatiglandales bacterium]
MAKQQNYSFITPWLALNKKSYEKYQRLGAWLKRKKMMGRILVGNVISMSKGLGYTVPAPIEVRNLNLKEIQSCLKGNPMLGFLGTFSINFEIPDYWGIGKSVSRGFGTVKRLKDIRD